MPLWVRTCASQWAKPVAALAQTVLSPSPRWGLATAAETGDTDASDGMRRAVLATSARPRKRRMQGSPVRRRGGHEVGHAYCDTFVAFVTLCRGTFTLHSGGTFTRHSGGAPRPKRPTVRAEKLVGLEGAEPLRGAVAGRAVVAGPGRAEVQLGGGAAAVAARHDVVQPRRSCPGKLGRDGARVAGERRRRRRSGRRRWCRRRRTSWHRRWSRSCRRPRHRSPGRPLPRRPRPCACCSRGRSATTASGRTSSSRCPHRTRRSRSSRGRCRP